MDIDRLHEQASAFAEAVQGLDPDIHVPTCPEWPVRVLVGHVGQAFRWSAEIVRTGEPAAIPDPHDADPGAPSEWSGWLLDSADVLTSALKEAGETTVWTFVGPRPASFWLRRMLHDASVHYVDAAMTAGIDYEIPEDQAADAITEGLELLSTPGVSAIKPGLAELRGDGQTLRFQAEGQASWRVTRTPEGVTWEHATVQSDVTVSGKAQDLLLLFYRRLSPDHVHIAGDRDLLTHWLAHTSL